MAEDVLKSLPARSVVLSLMLGHHPDRISGRSLTKAGEYFDIPASTLRVALTRAVANGELRREGKDYALGDRLLTRQRRQDEAIEQVEAPWDGDWELAVVVVTGRTGSERAALREGLSAHRLAELREGVWMRPANLQREPSYRTNPVLNSFSARCEGNPAELASQLWDLTDWSKQGNDLETQLRGASEPAVRLAIAAKLVRHLASDPILPASLLPKDWSGARLRAVYAEYQHELHSLV